MALFLPKPALIIFLDPPLIRCASAHVGNQNAKEYSEPKGGKDNYCGGHFNISSIAITGPYPEAVGHDKQKRKPGINRASLHIIQPISMTAKAIAPRVASV
jgi:hypothetical protein